MPSDAIVYVVDDDAAVRDGLRFLVESVDLRVESCASAQAFLDAYDASRPGCLVLDVRLRGMSGLDLQDELAKRGVSIPTIIITGHGDVPMAVRAMKMGAVDFVEKPFNDQQLLDRIQQAIDKDRDRRRDGEERAHMQARLATLSPREREVMDLLVVGKANKEVAEHLGLSTRTVEGHRARLMEKLGCESLAELVRISLACAPPAGT
ncbi:MAG: response regulator [Thermodesulfobacteriota bacterium]